MPRGKHTMPRSKNRGHTLVTEMAEWQRTDKIVCPICGGVWEGEVRIGEANGLEAYIMQGYDPRACPDCEAAGRAVGFSGEFNFDQEVDDG